MDAELAQRIRLAIEEYENNLDVSLKLIRHLDATITRAVRNSFTRYFKQAVYDFSGGLYDGNVEMITKGYIMKGVRDRSLVATVAKTCRSATAADLDWQFMGSGRLSLASVYVESSGFFCFPFDVTGLKFSLPSKEERDSVKGGRFKAKLPSAVEPLLVKVQEIMKNFPAILETQASGVFKYEDFTDSEYDEAIKQLKESVDVLKQVQAIKVSPKLFNFVFQYNTPNTKPGTKVREIALGDNDTGGVYYLLHALLDANFAPRLRELKPAMLALT